MPLILKKNYEQVTKVFLELSDFKLIIAADFNAVINFLVDSTPKKKKKKNASEALRSWISDNGVVDLWRILNPDVKDFNHLSSRHKFFSRIDLIISSRGLFHTIIKAILLPVAFSDHKAVIAFFFINSNPELVAFQHFISPR